MIQAAKIIGRGLATTVLIGIGVVFGALILGGIDINITTMLPMSIPRLWNMLQEFTGNYHYEYHYMHDYSSFPLVGEENNFDFNFSLDNGVHFLDEKNLLENGVAGAEDARIRDNTISNGYDPRISHQPYGWNLAYKLEQDRNGSSQLPSTILPSDAAFIEAIAPHVWPNYDPNRHYLNSSTMRTALRRLP